MTGKVVYLFAFDVANEIVASRIQTVLAERPSPFRVRTDHTHPRDVPLHQPLAIETNLHTSVFGQPLSALIRIYDVGAVTISLSAPILAGDLAALHSWHNPRTADGLSLDALARRLCNQTLESLRDLLVHPSPPTDPEAYTVFCLTDLESTRDANAWLADHRREVAGLLTQTASDKLSESQVAEVLRLQRSFEQTDLVIIDWDAALIVDLEGYVDDVLYVLELANLQLEELRVMDRALDEHLNRAYDDVGRRSLALFGASAVLRVLRQYWVDLAKLIDEVTHITKFLGDWHLARVHQAARERFYLDQWRASVERRLSQLDQLYGVVRSEIYEQRMFWLEVLIVVFFVIDLVAMFTLRK